MHFRIIEASKSIFIAIGNNYVFVPSYSLLGTPYINSDILIKF